MNKKMIVAAFVVGVVTLHSCAKTESATAPSADADTTAVEVVEAAPAEEDRSEEIRNRVTYDLAYYELHGPVYVLKEEYHTVTFSEDGQIISLDGYDPFTAKMGGTPEHAKIIFARDSEGRIAEQTGWEFYETYTWNGMRLSTSKWDAEGMWGKDYYTYNDEGHLVSIKSVEGEVDCEETTTTTYRITYISFDEYGNWTARKANGNVEKRTITYY